jgi:acyl dehydratase
VYLGDTITATVTVSKFRAEKGVLTLLTECRNQDGVKVVDGMAVVLVTDILAADAAQQAGEDSETAA